MLKKVISPGYIPAAAAGALIIVGAPAAASARLPRDGLVKALADSGSPAVLAASVFALVGSFWLVGPLARSLESGDRDKAEAALAKYHRRRVQVSMLAALAIYFGAGLGVWVAYHGGSSWEGYFRAHILDGFGCAGFFAVGWSQMDRHADRGVWLLTSATAGIAAAAAFVAGGTGFDVAFIGVLGWGYGYLIWGYITHCLRVAMTQQLASGAAGQYEGAVADFLAQHSRPENHAAAKTAAAGLAST